MPTYEYVCKECGNEFSAFQTMSEARLDTCPKCGKKNIKRKIGSGAGMIFKGSGFYCTDYKHTGACPAKSEHAHSHGDSCSCCPHSSK